jgi:ABC-type transport system substrate-binding protein
VFVLGAGASQPYGFPTGAGLATEVCAKLSERGPDTEFAVQDPYRLTISTNEPSPIMPAQLTDTSTAIVSAAAAEAMGEAFADKPVMTGPFKVAQFEFNKELVAVRHTDYWGPRSHLDRSAIRIPEPGHLLNASS